ncbi:unnamed protein product, partial [Prorocentrum cordatum]
SVLDRIDAALNQTVLQVAWNAVLMEVDNELLDRWGVTGRDRAKRCGRLGVICTQGVVRKWKPPCMGLHQSTQAHPWGAAAKWAEHLGSTRSLMVAKIQWLQAATAMCTLSDCQFDDIVFTADGFPVAIEAVLKEAQHKFRRYQYGWSAKFKE